MQLDPLGLGLVSTSFARRAVCPFDRFVGVLLLAVVASAGASFAQYSGLRFEVSFPKSASATPLDGHVFLLISMNDHDEPRFQIAEDFAESQQAFGLDVDGARTRFTGRRRRQDLRLSHAQSRRHPRGRLLRAGSDQYLRDVSSLQGHTVKLPPDKGEGSHWQTKPGNLYSRPQKMHIDPKSSQAIRISLTEKIPPIEKELAEVDSVLDWGRGLGEPVSENKWVKRIHFQSDLLTKFWGRPTYLGAIVLLPDGYDEHPQAHYPVVVEQDHFHRDLFLAEWVSNRAARSKTEGCSARTRALRLQVLPGLDFRTPAARDHRDHPASDALLRRLLRRELREPGSVRRCHQ